MATTSPGARVGTAFVDIHPALAPGFHDTVDRLLAPIRGKFKQAGDRAGKDFTAGVDRQIKPMKGDMFGLSGALSKVGKDADSVRKSMKGLETDMFGVGKAAKSAGVQIHSSSDRMIVLSDRLKQATQSSGGLSSRLTTLRGRLKQAGDVAQRSSRGFDNWGQQIANANRNMLFLSRIMRLIKPAVLLAGLGIAASGVSALTAAVVALAGALGPLIGLAAAAGGALAALGQSLGVFKLATTGIGAALKEQLNAQTSAAGGAVKSAKQQVTSARAITAAEEGVRRAKEAVAPAIERLKDAQKGLTDSRREARRELQDLRVALDDATHAETRQNLALRDAKKALRELLASPSLRDVADANEEVSDSVRDHEGAVLALIDAQKALDDLLKPADQLDIADAQNAIADSLREEERAAAALEAQRARTAEMEAAAGSSPADQARVAAARLALADAEDALADAKRNTARAQEALAKLEAPPDQHELAKARHAVADAEDAVNDARLDSADAQKALSDLEDGPSQRQIADARRDVADAERDLAAARRERARAEIDLARAEKLGVTGSQQMVAARRELRDADRALADAQRDVRDAMRGVSEAQQDATLASAGAAAGAANLNEEFDKLPAPAQAFVRTLIALKPRLDQLRATAVRGFFPGATKGLLAAVKNFDAVNKVTAITSRVLGGLAQRAGQVVGSKAFGKDLVTIGSRNANVIGRVGDAAINLGDAFRHMLVAAGPLLTWLSKVTKKWSENVLETTKAGRENGRLAAFFDRTRQILTRLVSIIGGVAGGFKNVARAARPLTDAILAALDRAANGWERWTGSIEGKNTLAQYFAEAKGPIFEMGRLIRDLTRGFFNLANQPGLEALLHQIRTELVPAFGDLARRTQGMFGPAIVHALTNVLRLFGQIVGPLSTVVKILGNMAGGLATVLEKVPGVKQLAVAFLAVVGGLKAMKFAAAITGISGLARGAASATVAYRSLAAGQTLSEVATKRGIGATIAAKVAQLATAAATKVWTAAQWLLNAAMRANPLGLIITGLVALTAGLVAAYKKSETFREIVNGVWETIKKVAGSVIGWLSSAIPAAWNAIKTVTAKVWDGISAYFKVWWTVFSTVFKTYIGAVKTVLSTAWSVIKTVASTAWQGIKTVIVNPVRTAFDWVRTAVGNVRQWLGERWENIKTNASNAWQRVKELIINPVTTAKETVVRIADNLWGNLKGGFNTVKAKIGEWGGDLKEKILNAFKGGVNAVIGFVNDIIGVVNKIPGVEIDKIPKLATGGKASSAGVDKDPQMLATGGKVTRPMAIVGEEAPRHPEYVIPTNPAYRGRALALTSSLMRELGMGGVPGFALGGVIDKVKDTVGAGLDLVKGGAGAITKLLPNPADLLPKWLHGFGAHVIDKVKDWIVDKVKSLLPVGGGSGGGPGGFKSGTWALANLLASKFGLAISSSYRDPQHNAAVGGVPGSSHTKGSPANPGAHDFVPPSYAALRYAVDKLGAMWADIHDFGSGLHLHVSWFKQGGVIGKAITQSVTSALGGIPKAHQGGIVRPPGGQQEMLTRLLRDEVVLNPALIGSEIATAGGTSKPELLLPLEVKIGDETIEKKVVRLQEDKDRRDRGRFIAGVAG